MRVKTQRCCKIEAFAFRTKVIQYKEEGRSRTEAGGADQPFHPPRGQRQTGATLFHHIRNQKEPKSGRIKSHWTSEAQFWLSRAEGHTRCTTGMFSAYLCGQARPPVTTQKRTTWVGAPLSCRSLHCRKQSQSQSYREKVHGWLRRVHDEVAQGESEALDSSMQQHGFGPGPGELLICRVLRSRRAGQAPPFWGFILRERHWN